MDSCLELQNILHTEIPITRQIGIQVEHCDINRIVLSAPIEPNTNHKCTAFGGSLYSVAVLAGWSLVYYNMKHYKLSGHIVIQHSEVDYLSPVNGQITAECVINNSDKKLLHFIKSCKRKGRGRISLQVKVIFDDADAMILNGQYVVHQ